MKSNVLQSKLFKNKILKNASWIIVCKIMQSILNLFIGMITARYLGPSNYGLINYAASIAAFFLPLMRLGLTSTLVQEFVSRPEEEGKVLGTSLFLNILSGFLSVVGICSFCMVAHAGERQTVLVCVLYSFTLLFQAAEMTQYWFQAKLLSKYPSIVSLVAYVVVSLYKIYVLAAGKSVYWFAVTHVIEAAIIAAVLLILYRRVATQKLGFSFALAKQMLSKSKYYIISGMAVIIVQYTDKFMLKNMMNDEVTGFYSAAVTCAGVTSFVFVAIIDSMRPQILKHKQTSTEKFEEHISILYSVVCYLSLAQCLVTTLFAKPIVWLLYGEEYLPAAVVLQVVGWVITFGYMGNVISIWILGEHKDTTIIWLGIFGATTNVVLNLLFIPKYGAVGAAAASLITQFLKNFVFCLIVKPLRRSVYLMLRGMNPKFAIAQIRKRI